MYQVEVYGYTAATYRLTVEITSAAANAQRTQIAGGIDPTKPQPSEPVVPVDSEPGTQLALPPAISIQYIYLPIVLR
jgi:hypothetical protein